MLKSIRPMQNGTFHSTATVCLLAAILCSCAGLSGSIDRIYLLGNTSGDHDFALELLQIVNNLEFPPIESGCREAIIIPRHFYP